MQRLRSNSGDDEVERSMERHKTLLMRTARSLLRDLRPTSTKG